MSDTCYFEMTVLKKDVEKINKIMFGNCKGCPWGEENENDDGTISLIEYEANYGYYDQLLKLAEEGIVFEGSHGAGGGYGESVFACCNGKQVEASAIEGAPVAHVHKDGNIDAGVRACIEDYYQTLEAVNEYFKENGINANS